MHRKNKVALSLAIVVIATLASISVMKQRINASRQQRESHFITVHYLAVQELLVGNPERPADLSSLLSPYDDESALTGPFPNGLIYRSDGASFQLEEPDARRVSLFQSDRLIATDKLWPRWEATGVPARKFSGQVVPPPGYDE